MEDAALDDSDLWTLAEEFIEEKSNGRISGRWSADSAGYYQLNTSCAARTFWMLRDEVFHPDPTRQSSAETVPAAETDTASSVQSAAEETPGDT
uniref:Uncharacterized protein n=1 Tax=Mycena chlorophos TaxID=658473 RepID=A0ABQ0L9X9_MYCCL|nr:predicted protein [Mycena chlorophos]